MMCSSNEKSRGSKLLLYLIKNRVNSVLALPYGPILYNQDKRHETSSGSGFISVRNPICDTLSKSTLYTCLIILLAGSYAMRKLNTVQIQNNWSSWPYMHFCVLKSVSTLSSRGYSCICCLTKLTTSSFRSTCPNGTPNITLSTSVNTCKPPKNGVIKLFAYSIGPYMPFCIFSIALFRTLLVEYEFFVHGTPDSFSTT